MNQKLSWSLLIGGLVFFLGQFAELIANHSTWSELLTPASTADLLRLLAAVVPTVAGALGISLAQSGAKRDDNRITHRATRRIVPVLLLAALGLGTAACATGAAGAAITLSPSDQQIETTRKAAIKIAGAIETGAGLVDQALKFADGLERAGKLAPAKLAGLAQAAKTASGAMRTALHELEATTTNPSLMATVTAVLKDLDPFLARLEQSGDDTLRVLAGSIRIGMQVVSTFKLGGGL